MPWTPLNSRLATLPLVIAGPILRRTERDSVSVWIALKERTNNIYLEVYERANPASTILRNGTASSTIALGDHLHVAVVNASPTNPGILLQPGTIYLYDLILGSRAYAQLGSPGVLNPPGNSGGAISKIAYGSFNLPSFVLPSSNMNNLRIIHGSCRKPHGGKTDALRALDVMIENTYDDPIRRPQQLYLTGDQIYADDVADVLLFMLMDAGRTLLGWDETLPTGVPASDLIPGNRQQLMESNNFTSGEAKSHLMKLYEFYAMYLFTWSDELWGAESATFSQVFPGVPTRRPTPSHWQTRARGLMPPTVPTLADSAFNQERWKIERFRRSLPFVRKALANIPSYMIFDDHEITDDWFLTKKWAEDALAPGTLSRRIIQNGLAAFAIFQSWGNNPTAFQTGTAGRTLVDQLINLHTQRGSNPSGWNNIGTTLLPRVVSSGGRNYRLEHGFTWHFSIVFDAFQVVFLDTRTHRGFYSQNGPPSLVHSAGISHQIPPRPADRELMILISPAPVTGHSFVEETVQPTMRTITTIFNFSVAAGSASADYEAWLFNRYTFEALLENLAQHERVLILSGDVHYGFSNSIQYWDERTTTVRRAAFAQLCSSAQKNEDTLTNTIANRFLGPNFVSEYLGWTTPGGHIMRTLGGSMPIGTLYVRGTPAVHRMGTGDRAATPPKWRYRIIFAKDNRSESTRLSPAATGIRGTAQQQAGRQHRRRTDWGAHRTVVGKDNLAEIRFEWTAQLQKAKHNLWYVPAGDPEDNSLLLPYTEHEVYLTVPTSRTPAPG